LNYTPQQAAMIADDLHLGEHRVKIAAQKACENYILGHHYSLARSSAKKFGLTGTEMKSLASDAIFQNLTDIVNPDITGVEPKAGTFIISTSIQEGIERAKEISAEFGLSGKEELGVIRKAASNVLSWGYFQYGKTIMDAFGLDKGTQKGIAIRAVGIAIHKNELGIAQDIGERFKLSPS
jgi:hypothetical protein